ASTSYSRVCSARKAPCGRRPRCRPRAWWPSSSTPSSRTPPPTIPWAWRSSTPSYPPSP
ncbi:hypothetical protein IWW55_004986, partial [Coemansia sp. RSA 2706]